ncbi:MAG: tRNA pseudouridine(55) synthase TruB [Candidatus Syntrophosphaera sp.]
MRENSGFILIDKPAGISSFDVIRRLRRITGIRKIGHTGTLDPFATGLLICALGSYTRLCKYLEAEDKSYQALLKLGEETSTGDTEGEITSRDGVIPENIPLEKLTSSILSLEELPTPRYSAVKIKGKPAYAYAREGFEMELPDRPARISAFEVLSYEPPLLSYSCRVSKGTYVRSLSEFIARGLGSIGHTVQLRRTAIGGISVEESVTLEELGKDNFEARFYPPARLFENYEQYLPGKEDIAKLAQGQAVSQDGKDNQAVILFDGDGDLFGVAKRTGGMLYPLINLV